MSNPDTPLSALRQVEFWFDFGSSYSYPAVMRIEEAARRQMVEILWRPFLLGVVFKALGQEQPPFVIQKEKGAYVWMDMPRQCRKYGLRWNQPSVFPRAAVLPSRVALLGANEDWIGAFCRDVMELNFVHDQDINSLAQIETILRKLDLPAREVLQDAQSEPIKTRLREQTSAAITKGIFGAPTFFVQAEMFWGNDRLDEALDCAAHLQ